MPPTEFHLYRIKFIKPAQTKLFHHNLTARDLLEDGLLRRPSVELRKNHVWHIGNVEYLEDGGGRFAIGRTTKTTIEKFDDRSGDFVEQLDDSGPYTYVYFDSKLGLLAIAKKTKVAPSVGSIASKIQQLFSQTQLARETNVDVKVDIIPDPESFLRKLRRAYAIKRFRADFTGPNPVDADELFQKPMSYYCQQLEAIQGSVTVMGDSLNEENVAAVAKSTAATGNSATALIQPEKGSRLISISIEGNATKITVDSDSNPNETLVRIQNAYLGVRL